MAGGINYTACRSDRTYEKLVGKLLVNSVCPLDLYTSMTFVRYSAKVEKLIFQGQKNEYKFS